MEKRQIAWLQWLRCFGTVAVVLMHTCAGSWYDAPMDSQSFRVLNFFEGLVRWPVPLFVMISGALFLQKDRSWGRIFGKYILRVAIAFLFWSGLYVLHGERTLRHFLLGHYHLWYLWLCCGLYLLSPFLGKIARDEKLRRAFLVITLISGNVLPRLAELVVLLDIPNGAVISALLGKGKLYFCMGYVFQFVLGYDLSRRELSAPARGVLYLLGIGGMAVTIWGTTYLSRLTGERVQLLYEPQSFHVTVTAAALFVFVKTHCKKLPRPVASLAKCSFGIYLSHALVLELLSERGITALAADPRLAVPVITIGVLAVCWLLTALLRKIPVIGKIVV